MRFEIADGPHLSVSRVTFEGDPEVSAKLLQRQMRRINPGALFGSLQGKNSYSREALEEDGNGSWLTTRIMAIRRRGLETRRYRSTRSLHNAGFRGRERRWMCGLLSESRSRLAQCIELNRSGPARTLRRQAVTAAHKSPIASTEELLGRPYSARTVENLRRAWQARAQPKAPRNQEANFFNVEAIRTLDPNSRSVRILFDRNPTPPYMVRRLEFRGIHRFPDRYFRSRIVLKEGAPVR